MSCLSDLLSYKGLPELDVLNRLKLRQSRFYHCEVSFLTSEMVRSLASLSSPSPRLLDSAAIDLSRRRRLMVAVASCSGKKNYPYIPKHSGFIRQHPLDYLMKDPPLLEKAEQDISDYCVTLEGDECYYCWRAYFELCDLKKELPKEEVEALVRQAQDVETLVEYLHRFTAMLKRCRQEKELRETSSSVEEEKQSPSLAVEQKQSTTSTPVEEKRVPFPVPDYLPKTWEELQEEEKAKWEDTPHMRLLRRMGTPPAWYTPRPDHETD